MNGQLNTLTFEESFERNTTFSDEELWSYLIDNDSNVIMPPKRSYYIKANIVKIVRGKPSKAD